MIETILDLLAIWIEDALFGNWLKRLVAPVVIWCAGVLTLLGLTLMAYDSVKWMWNKIRRKDRNDTL